MISGVLRKMHRAFDIKDKTSICHDMVFLGRFKTFRHNSLGTVSCINIQILEEDICDLQNKMISKKGSY